jgi:hypothetical protein
MGAFMSPAQAMQHFTSAIERATMHGLDTSEIHMAVQMCECPSQLVQAVESAAQAKDALGVGMAWNGRTRQGVAVR